MVGHSLGGGTLAVSRVRIADLNRRNGTSPEEGEQSHDEMPSPVDRLDDALAGTRSSLELIDSVDDWLVTYLEPWLVNYFRDSGSLVLDEVSRNRREPKAQHHRNYVESLKYDDFPDVIHLTLRFGARAVGDRRILDAVHLASAVELEKILSEAGFYLSATPAGLEYRVDPTVVNLAETAADEARRFGKPNAATRLESAWKKAYSLHPEPTESIAEAIRAVEAVMLPIVVPNDLKAMYPRGVGTLRDNKDKWRLVIETQKGADDIDVVISMLDRLGTAHLERHEGNVAKGADTVESARACVHLAATLVQWFSMGAVVKR